MADRVSGTASGPVAQVFGIRVDQAVQELRDFIVDSQLMQDFDDPSAPTHNADGVARYQTHLTLIDATKAPLINESVKLWADQANTIVLVNGQSYTIGPDDDQFASVKTSSSGQLVIVSGYTQADGSDTSDMNAVPLRAWAPFMNPYERMLVLRDQEFHNRVATAHSTDPSQAGADDPTRANLQTAQTYGDLQNQGNGTTNPLFTDQQKQDNQPQPGGHRHPDDDRLGRDGSAVGQQDAQSVVQRCMPPTPRGAISPTPTRPARSTRR